MPKQQILSDDLPTVDAGYRARSWPGRIAAFMRRDVALVCLDLGVVVVGYLVPLVLVFSGRVPSHRWLAFWRVIPILVVLHLSINLVFGLYGQMWRYASVHEARRVVQAGLVAPLLFIAAGPIALHATLPPSVLLSGAMCCLLGFGLVRFESRLFGLRRRQAGGEPARTLIVGAGDAGSMVLKDIQRNPSVHILPVGLVDDDPKKIGRALHGVRVYGGRGSLPRLLSELRVEQVLLALPSATSEVVRDVARVCEKGSVAVRVLPSVREIVGDRVTARDIRDLRIEDLLGRQQVSIDLNAVGTILSGRRVLITGAGGSIGSEIARQVLEFEPAWLTLVDHDETHLHDLFTDLPSDGPIEQALADIRDRERVMRVFHSSRPEVVFHAAAHKHVDLLEQHAAEALYTNIMGTANVVDAAVSCGAERFVLISTDKAVKPKSVMGASKWFAEQVVRSVQDRGAAFCAVRFGNVLGSRGSVIPKFLRQIARGGPVTVTDPAMARYFMSVGEAVQLVLQAAAQSTGGEVFTLDMGEPMNILDLAHKLIRLSGQVPDREVAISFVGCRPGEKIVEDLVDPEEKPIPSAHPGIVTARPEVPDRASLRRAIHELEAVAEDDELGELAGRIKELATRPLGRPAVPVEAAL